MTAEMAVGYGALRERYTSDVTLDPAIHRIDVAQIKGPFKTLENHWQFTPRGEGCEIDFSILFEFKSRLLHSVAGAKFEKVMLKMADAFEARAKDNTRGECGMRKISDRGVADAALCGAAQAEDHPVRRQQLHLWRQFGGAAL